MESYIEKLQSIRDDIRLECAVISRASCFCSSIMKEMKNDEEQINRALIFINEYLEDMDNVFQDMRNDVKAENYWKTKEEKERT